MRDTYFLLFAPKGYLENIRCLVPFANVSQEELDFLAACIRVVVREDKASVPSWSVDNVSGDGRDYTTLLKDGRKGC